MKNILIFGFYTLHVFYSGKVKMYGTKGKSFVANSDTSGAMFSEHESVDIALAKAKEWGTFIWNNNDRKALIEEYNLTKDFVREFLGYTWPLQSAEENIFEHFGMK